ncbi:MAG: hypothetical protein JF617_20915 [Burkholderiales bacterium]|nr:hypothetical protein [Burkholderiales bacterium]
MRPRASTDVAGLAARGFTYLGMLFLVALTAAALAALGQAWTTAAQREKERELEWRGGEIARAIASYAKASTNPPGQYPRSLDDLLIDRRGVNARHHLRRAYVDPFTCTHSTDRSVGTPQRGIREPRSVLASAPR